MINLIRLSENLATGLPTLSNLFPPSLPPLIAAEGCDDLDLFGRTFLDLTPNQSRHFIKNTEVITQFAPQSPRVFSLKTSTFAPIGATPLEIFLQHRAGKSTAAKAAEAFFAQYGVTLVDKPSALCKNTEINKSEAVFFHQLLLGIEQDRTNIQIIDTAKLPTFKNLMIEDLKKLSTRAPGRTILLALTRLPFPLPIEYTKGSSHLGPRICSIKSIDLTQITVGADCTMQINPERPSVIIADTQGFRLNAADVPSFITFAHEALHALFVFHLNRCIKPTRSYFNALLQTHDRFRIFSSECNNNMDPFDGFFEYLAIEGDRRLPWLPSENCLLESFGLPTRYGHHLSTITPEIENFLLQSYECWSQENQSQVTILSYWYEILNRLSSPSLSQDFAKAIPADYCFRREILQTILQDDPQALNRLLAKEGKTLEESALCFAAILQIVKYNRLSKLEKHLCSLQTLATTKWQQEVASLSLKMPLFYFAPGEVLIAHIKKSLQSTNDLQTLLASGIPLGNPRMPLLQHLYIGAIREKNAAAMKLILQAAEAKGISLENIDRETPQPQHALNLLIITQWRVKQHRSNRTC